jgi:CubicO group peptidase (beta-lactamase class C family)
MLKEILTILIAFTFPTISWGQHSFYKLIDSIVISKMTEYRIKGLSLSIVKDGKNFYTKGYGFTSVDSENIVTPETRFVTASITKLFTATAVMQLVEQGKLDLNKKLIEYIPDFKPKDNRFKDITLLHLLTHSSGLPWDNELKKATSDSIALKEFVFSLYDTKLKFSPGEKFSGETYSNTGYDILGYLIEKITLMPFQEYVKRNILEKAAMSNSTFYLKTIPEKKLAAPLKISGDNKEINRFNLYGEIKDINPVLKYPELPIVEWPDYQWGKPEHNPSGYLYSTAGDLNNWIIYCLKIYNNSKTSFLSATTLTNMWALQRSIENKKTSIGLGWWRFSDSLSGNYVFHVGRDPGYSSTLRIYPGKNIGITILSNAMYADKVIWNELPELIMKVVNYKDSGR